MQIRIEIDVKPEELRRFLGLPDVAGLQEDVIAFLRDKVGAASEFDAAAFVKGNLDTLWRNPALRRLLQAATLRSAADAAAHEAGEEAKAAEKPRPRAPKKKATARPRRTAASRQKRGS